MQAHDLEFTWTQASLKAKTDSTAVTIVGTCNVLREIVFMKPNTVHNERLNTNVNKASKKLVYLEVISGGLFSSEVWGQSQGWRSRKDDMQLGWLLAWVGCQKCCIKCFRIIHPWTEGECFITTTKANQASDWHQRVAVAVMALTMYVFCHGLFSESQVENFGDLTRKSI